LTGGITVFPIEVSGDAGGLKVLNRSISILVQENNICRGGILEKTTKFLAG
jgi:hypothetical protein